MDRRQLDEVVAHLDRLHAVTGAAARAGWQDLWRVVTDDRRAEPPASVEACLRAVDQALGHPDHRLVAYGTLRPGEANHHLVAGLGRWQAARVRGTLGDWHGYPILRPAASGPELAVMLLTSSDLPAVLPDLDRFEGPAYRRSWVVAQLDTSEAVVARCYVDTAR